MADVERIVDLIFKATDKATSPLRAIDKATAGAGDRLRSFLELLHVLNGASQLLGPVFETIKDGVVGLNRNLEETQLKIAGAMKAFSFVETFQEGQREAVDALQIIRKTAAALPGEVEDYVQVFEAGLPKAIEAGIASTEKIADFTSRFAAVAIAQGVDAAQASGDIMRMLGGQAGMDIRMWTSLAPLIGKSAQEFNKMSAADRYKAVASVLDKYDDLLGSFGNTLSAVEGTLKSQFKDFVATATKPLFDAWKGALITVTGYLGQNEAQVAGIAALIGGAFTQGLNRAQAGMMRLRDMAQGVYTVLESSGAMDGLRALVGLASGALDAAMGSGFTGIVGAVMLRFGMVGGLLVAGLQELFSNTGAITSIFQSMSAIVGEVVALFTPLSQAVAVVGSFLGELAATILPPFMAGVATLAAGLRKGLEHVSAGLIDFIGKIRKPVMRFAEVIGGLWEKVSIVVAPLIEAFGVALRLVAGFLGDRLASALNAVATALGWLLDAIESIIDYVKGTAAVDAMATAIQSINRGRQGSAGTTPAPWEPALQGYVAQATLYGGELDRSRLSRMAADAQAKKEAERLKRLAGDRKPPGARGKSQQVFDFRNSRFSIEQRFMEGFDPNRIAVAFAHDVAALGEMRVQSGLAPLYAPR